MATETLVVAGFALRVALFVDTFQSGKRTPATKQVIPKSKYQTVKITFLANPLLKYSVTGQIEF